MVQLSSPRPDMMPVPSGDKKMRTVSRTDKAEKPEESDFSKTLEKKKVAEKKDNAQGSSKRKKTETARSDEAARNPEKGIDSEGKAGRIGTIAIPKGSAKPESLLADPPQKKGIAKLLEKPVLSKAARKKNVSVLAENIIPAAGPSDHAKEIPSSVLTEEKEAASEKGRVQEAVLSGRNLDAAPQTETGATEAVQAAVSGEPLEENWQTGEKEGKQDGKKKKLTGSPPAPHRQNSGIISVEDRRTVRAEEVKTVFAPSKEQQKESLTLEMAPQEDPDGTVLAADSRNTSHQFSLHSAEEQKGSFLLNKQLQEGGTKELAKNIRFVLKDNNQGEIKLILKPEALGKVRIQLNLQENNIVGKIFVENNSVKQVFMNNLPNLVKALEESGFQTTSLDVSVGGGETGRRDDHRDEAPVYFTREAENLESQIPVVFDGTASLSQINLVV